MSGVKPETGIIFPIASQSLLKPPVPSVRDRDALALLCSLLNIGRDPIADTHRVGVLNTLSCLLQRQIGISSLFIKY